MTFTNNRPLGRSGRITAAEIERVRAVPIQDEVARRGAKLRRRGRHSFVGPCPVCGGDDRFAINTKKQLWNCRGCGVGGDVIDFARHVDGYDFVTAVTTLVGNSLREATPPKPEEHDGDKDHEHRNLERAKASWGETSPLGQDAIKYFASRRIDINNVPGHGGLRFHPYCPWGKGWTPAIIGRFTTALGNEPRGIWRRPLSGETPMTLGPIAGCIIRLWPDEAVERGLVLGEGVETVFAAATRISNRGALLQPAWAAGGTGNIRKFPILSGVESLTLLVDNDLPDQHDRRAGQDAAAACAARWCAAGREVIRLTPKALDADFNDVVLRHGR